METGTDELPATTRQAYPAIKIARIARCKSVSQKGVGSRLLKYAIGMLLAHARMIGARFITVDAYPQKVDFYKAHGFVCNHPPDELKGRRTVSMRFDLVTQNDAPVEAQQKFSDGYFTLLNEKQKTRKKK